MESQPYNAAGGSDDGGSSAIVGDYIYRLKGGDGNGDGYSGIFYRYNMPSTTPTATATGPTGTTNNSSVTLTYNYTGSPTSVKLYYTKNTSSPYTWTLAVNDTTVNGLEAYTITAGDGTYGWNAVEIGGGSTETDPPAGGTAPEAASLILDTVAPTVSYVTSTAANGTYGVGQVIPVTVTFSAVVNVTGTPQLTLETGTTDRNASYASGSGSATLTFNYTVQAGDMSSDLDYTSTTALALNGGTIKDAAGNNATLTLPTPGAPGSLGANKNIVIETIAPPAPSLVSPSDGTITSDNTPTFVWTSVTDPSGVTYRIQVDNDPDFSSPEVNVAGLTDDIYTSSALVSENYSWRVRAVDGAGNPSGWSSVWTFVIDTTAPTVTVSPDGTSTNSSPITFTMTFSESVTGLTASGITVTNWTKVTLSGSGTTYTLPVTPAGQGAVTCQVNAGAAHDAVGNNNTASNTASVTCETIAPPAPSLVSPSDSTITSDNTPTFVWTSVTDPSGVTYQIQVDNDLDFLTPNENRIIIAKNWWNSNWQYKKQIEIDNSKVENENFSNFPVLISLSSDSDLAVHALNNGDDIVFVNSAENVKLAHEIENFNGSTGALVAWVRVPTLYDNENTVIYMYYGNPSASNQQNATGVWDDNYQGVWHMKDNSTSTTLDSTSNNNNGTKKAAGEPAATTNGKIDNAENFDGTNDYVNAGNAASLNYGTTFTIESWFKTSAIAWRWLVTKPGGSWFGISSGGNLDWTRVSGIDYVSSAFVANGVWHHGVVTFDSGNLNLYADSVKVGTWSGVSLAVTSGTTYIGQRGDAVEYFNGIIDEVRISNKARSKNWIYTEYNNENSPSTFYSVASEENYTADNHYTIADENALASFVQYYWRVRAVDGASNPSGWSSVWTFVIDTVTPTVTVSSVTSTAADGTYGVRHVIPVTVTFSAVVNVTGTPQLTLETGTTDRNASYASGSGSATLTFNYTVQTGDTSSDLDYTSTIALALNGGTIKDAAGNSATLTLPALGDENSLGYNKDIVIATPAPPNKPTNLSPSTRQTTTSVTISAFVTDNNGDNINVFFYDNSTKALIDNKWITSGGTAQVTWSGLTRGTTYVFFARGQDNNGAWGESSDTQSFKVNSLPIAENQKAENRVNPDNLLTSTPTLSWDFFDSDGDGQIKRRIQVGTVENDNSMWESTVSTSATSATYAGSALSNGVTYRWRIRVFDNYEWSSWRYGGTFKFNYEVIARSVEVSISPTSNSGLPGSTLTYTVTVINTGTVSDNYTLENTDNAGWTKSLSKTSVGPLAPNASENVTLTVTIPGGTTPGTRDNITVTATSTDNTVKDNASCIAQAITSIRPGVQVSISPDSQDNENGGTLTYTVTVTNTGNVTEDYDLAVDDDAGWTLTLPATVIGVIPDENRQVVLTVGILTTAENCTWDNITVTATSSENLEIKYSASCTARCVKNVAGVTSLTISPSRFALFPGYSGQVQSLTATLRAGNNPLPNKTITWSVASGSVNPSSGTTDAVGQVSVVYTAPTVTAETSQVTITASFAGDTQYKASSGTSLGIPAISVSVNISASTGGTVVINVIEINVTVNILVVPPNALSENTAITVVQAPLENLPDYKMVSHVFDVGPSGTTFTTPSTLTLPYDENELPAGVSEDDLAIYCRASAGGSWERVGGNVDKMANTVSVQIDHLSEYAVMVSISEGGVGGGELPLLTIGVIITVILIIAIITILIRRR
jgi:hypothetical protein